MSPQDASLVVWAALAGMLELGIACDQRPAALAFADLTNDPENLLAELALLAGALVPALAQPLLGSLAAALLALGAFRLARRR